MDWFISKDVVGNIVLNSVVKCPEVCVGGSKNRVCQRTCAVGKGKGKGRKKGGGHSTKNVSAFSMSSSTKELK